MKENVETGIRFKVVFIYLVVAAICSVTILYLYNLRENIDSQQEDIKQYYTVQALTSELVFSVNEAQTEANLYVSTKRASHLRNFRRQIKEVGEMVDSLHTFSGNPGRDSLLYQINLLLREKGRIVSALNMQFEYNSPVDSISKRLQAIDPVITAEPILVTTTKKDTVINTSPKKSFWRRLGNLFSPDMSVDTLVTVTTQNIDTIRFINEEQADLIAEMNTIAEQADVDYTSRLAAIEQQVGQLIGIDQQISVQISLLLHTLSEETMDATLAGVKKSRDLIRKNYSFSVAGGAMALVLILIFTVLIILDVSKGKKARKALRQIMDTRHLLFLSVSHDIKSPINSILGNVEGWKKEGKIPEAPAQSVKHAGEHILALMNNLLEFSNLEQGTLTVSESHFHLYALCAEMADLFVPLVQQKGLTMKCRFDMDKQLMIYGDVLKIKQILINILSNAVKYTAEGMITFEADYKDRQIIFNILDTGAGIPADKIDDIYQPFKRIEKNNQLATGSGLGMYVVKGLITLLHGSIHVSSVEQRGTTVSVGIPVKEGEWQKTITASHPLIVDDDLSLLAVLKDMFTQMGSSPQTCHQPEALGESIPLTGFDLLITDMEMGTTSGMDVLQKVRRTGIPMTIFVMTGRDDYSERKAKEDGFDGYLRKPVTRAMIAQLLGINTPAANEFETIEELLGGDKDMIADVLRIFADSTRENIKLLHQAIATDSFERAQAICHKMLPMCEQVGLNSCLETLRKMDNLRGCSSIDFPEWKEAITILITQAEDNLSTRLSK